MLATRLTQVCGKFVSVCGPATESGVSVDQGLRVEVVYVSHTPDSGLWKVCVSVDQGLRVEVVYFSHTPDSGLWKVCAVCGPGAESGSGLC